MLSEFVSANTRIAQVVWQRIPHRWTNHRESPSGGGVKPIGRWCLAGNVEWLKVVGWQTGHNLRSYHPFLIIFLLSPGESSQFRWCLFVGRGT